MSLVSSIKSKSMTINNSKQEMTSEYRQLQYELQCQEALLVLMQKLKINQRIISQTNNIKQRTTTPVNATKLNSITPPRQSSVYTFNYLPSKISLFKISTNRSTPIKPPHPNQYTVNRSNNNSQSQSSKISVPLPQATRQTNNPTLPATATRLSSTVPSTATKTSSTTNNTSKSRVLLFF